MSLSHSHPLYRGSRQNGTLKPQHCLASEPVSSQGSPCFACGIGIPGHVCTITKHLSWQQPEHPVPLWASLHGHHQHQCMITTNIPAQPSPASLHGHHQHPCMAITSISQAVALLYVPPHSKGQEKESFQTRHGEETPSSPLSFHPHAPHKHHHSTSDTSLKPRQQHSVTGS